MISDQHLRACDIDCVIWLRLGIVVKTSCRSGTFDVVGAREYEALVVNEAAALELDVMPNPRRISAPTFTDTLDDEESESEGP